MLHKLAYRAVTELSPRLAMKAAHLWVYKGFVAVRAYKHRLKNKKLYPPFMFVALTNTCNLRCHGCWVEKEGTAFHLPAEDLDAIIRVGKKNKAYYYTLLGGEPYMYKGIWDVFKRHKDCFFQTITNGMLFTEANVNRLAEAGNVTPLISIDGMQFQNDLRRGEGVFDSAMQGMERLKKKGIIFGVACTITGKNMEEVLCDSFLQLMIKQGAMYIWYYFYRPVGEDPHPEYCLSPIPSKRVFYAIKKFFELINTQIGRSASTKINEVKISAATHRQLGTKGNFLDKRIKVIIDILGVFIGINPKVTKFTAFPAKRNVRIKPKRRARFWRRV